MMLLRNSLRRGRGEIVQIQARRGATEVYFGTPAGSCEEVERGAARFINDFPSATLNLHAIPLNYRVSRSRSRSRSWARRNERSWLCARSTPASGRSARRPCRSHAVVARRSYLIDRIEQRQRNLPDLETLAITNHREQEWERTAHHSRSTACPRRRRPKFRRSPGEVPGDAKPQARPQLQHHLPVAPLLADPGSCDPALESGEPTQQNGGGERSPAAVLTTISTNRPIHGLPHSAARARRRAGESYRTWLPAIHTPWISRVLRTS